MIILLDSKNFVFKHGFPFRNLCTIDGVKTGAVFGVLNGLLALKRKFPHATFVAVWDGENATRDGWKKRIYPAYKGNRKIPAKNSDIAAILNQIPAVMEVFDLLHIKQCELPKVEADDVISLLAMALVNQNQKVCIYSSDRDFLQLMPYGINILHEIKEGFITPARVKNKFGVEPDKLLVVRALSGDNSDNIRPAVPGMGPKTAVTMLLAGADPTYQKFTDLPAAIQMRCERLRHGWNDFRRNFRLMQLPLHPRNAELSLHQQVTMTRFMSEVCFSQPLQLHSYRSMVEKLCELELAEALSFRGQLWRINRH